MPRKILIDDMSEVPSGSDSEEQSVAETETLSESHVRFFTDSGREEPDARL